ncbi:MAG: FAD-dependent oxidoreductase [Anaerolineae bacterium]
MRLLRECCSGCAYCIMVCPQNALTTDGWAHLLPERCTDCNLCYYACPHRCFVPEKELRPPRHNMATHYDVLVIGAGIGGLMTAAALARRGRCVAVFEQLSFPGGRYTELSYRGAAVTTAAWTSLGPKSHIGRFLAELGIGQNPEGGGLRYISLRDIGLREQYAIRFPDGQHYASLQQMLPSEVYRAWMLALARGRRGAPEDVSAHDYVASFCPDNDLLAVVDAIAITASGVGSQTMPASEFIQIVLDSAAAGTNFAMPAGGVAAIIDALVHTLKAHGGELHLGSRVQRIVLKHGQACRIELADGQQITGDIMVHNAGPSALIRLLGSDNLPPDYRARLQSLKGVECAAIFFATREPLFEDAPILMTPGCQRVAGIFSPTRLDPSLSRDGLHLYDAFLPLHSADRKAELALALNDLHRLFPYLDTVLVWHLPMFFTNGWPGTETAQTFGQTGQQRLETRTPIPGLYLVGMDVQGSGVAGDLIPLGVRRLLDEIG